MKKILFIALFIIPLFTNSQIRIIRDNDLEYNSHLYKVIKVPIMDDDYFDHWVYWMADDLKPSTIDNVMDMKTQEGQEGIGRFINGAFDSTSFNYSGALRSCPSGWKLPSMSDWEKLLNVMSDQQKMAFFNVLGGSKEIKSDTLCGNIFRKEIPLNGGYYWTYTESEDTAWRIEIDKNYYNVSRGKSEVSDFLLVRCIKNEDY